MDLKLLATVVVSVFIAELGDKTQLATILFAAGNRSQGVTVFIGAAAALTLSAGLGALVGCKIADLVEPRVLHYLAGVGFILIGIWTLLRA